MPDRFTLLFETDARTVQELVASGCRLVLAKHRPSRMPQVVWLALELTGFDTVTWEETYGVYAATEGPTESSPIRVTARVEGAADRAVHPFAAERFGPAVPTDIIPAGHVEVRNDSQSTVTFGLWQTARVSGLPRPSPLNAVAVPAGGTADFVPLTAISLGRLVETQDGSILSWPSTWTTVSFGTDQPIARYRYDRRRMRFIPVHDTGCSESGGGTGPVLRKLFSWL